MAVLKEELKVTVVQKEQFLTQLPKAAKQHKAVDKLLLPLFFSHCGYFYKHNLKLTKP